MVRLRPARAAACADGRKGAQPCEALGQVAAEPRLVGQSRCAGFGFDAGPAAARCGLPAQSHPRSPSARLRCPCPPAAITCLEALAREGQRAGTRQRAEQRRGDRPCRCSRAARSMSKAMTRRAAMPAAAFTACGSAMHVARLLLLRHRIGAVGGGDQHRPVGRHEAAQDGAARLHQFGGDHDVDVARRRHQREHRGLAALAAAASRCSRSWRRCAGRHPEPRSPGHASHWLPPPPRSSRSARRRPARPWRGWRSMIGFVAWIACASNIRLPARAEQRCGRFSRRRCSQPITALRMRP